MKLCVVKEEVTAIKLLREEPAGSRTRPASVCSSTSLRGLQGLQVFDAAWDILGQEERVTFKWIFFFPKEEEI